MKKNDNTFEAKMNKLQEIVSKMEKDNIDLDSSIVLYEEGLKLSKELQKELTKFENKIKELSDE